MPKGFLRGIVFFVFFEFFGLLDLEVFIGYRAGKKKKKLEENQTHQRNQKKPKSWEKCCAQGFPPGDWFFWLVSLVFLAFFEFLLFLIYEFVWHVSDIITKANVFGVTITKKQFLGGTNRRYKNQSHHFK